MGIVSDQAVQAAFEAYGDRYRSIDAMKDALTAAPTSKGGE